ncbi:MAG: FAD-binding oxidoreductase, partial [Mesorhizobium sp.]|nr:FAD-binding oxidoreductase [Mesorhizobium sp.]
MRASLYGLTAPPASAVIRSSSPSRASVPAPRFGKSRVKVKPGRGNDSRPGERIAPKRFSTVRNEPCPARRAAASKAGTLIDMRSMNRILSFNAETGTLEADAGVLLSDIIAHVAPHGFFPAVVPGTQFVTLGGAIANDVHGKNHHRRGTFGCHVEAITLLKSDGRIYRCSATNKARLFNATIGGMGLTGLIVAATIRLMRVPSLDIVEKATPFRNLEQFFDLAEAADQANEYVVAWIDQLAGGRHGGRGILFAGNHAERGSHMAARGDGALSVPVRPPFTVLNRPFLRLFNAAYRWRRGRSTLPRQVGYPSFFFPLDGLRDWNRLYGPRGLFQHQSV